MTRFSTLLLGLLVAGTLPALSQVAPHAAATATPPHPCGTFNGRIMAGDKPLAGASIFVKGTSIILITNEEGFFTLPASVVSFPTLAVSAAGYAPQELTYSSCTPVTLEMQLLPGTRIKQHGKRKGFIMKTGS
ncbi:carboxypeptidase-like regulatory domain-containing protein [Hymenobacter sp. BRD128]|uniref:carboxypeptidase-like regulatory domain-containing protein n=1 Tax=Hymenobacter sp. BRD128 TaxID=2675878 RepID=UPI00156466A2|nr:carboxypeptidase-like regulatory domain-containing protein [Hymenobacter sp. BRD128]QKG58278.1 carboxypeptidase-like regulatory domain-containing protein [Hymenobacter sp. BRD128]